MQELRPEQTESTNLVLELKRVLNTNNVYYQPPESMKLSFPCVVIERKNPYKIYADDASYNRRKHFELTVIDKDPDPSFTDIIADHFRYCSIENSFKANDFNNDVLSLYY